MDLGLQDTVALVVDSHLGIATAAAASLANEGAILSLTAPDNYHMRHVEIELARSNIPQDRFRAVIADLRRTRDIHRLVRETLHRQNDIGVLVNTVQELEPASAIELEEENIEPALARNFFAAVQLTREVVPHMKRLGMGRIVNLIPYSAIEVSSGGTLSSLSLAPLLAYFKGLAFELAPDHNNREQHHLFWCGGRRIRKPQSSGRSKRRGFPGWFPGKWGTLETNRGRFPDASDGRTSGDR